MITYIRNVIFAAQLFFSTLAGNRYEAGQRWGTGRSAIPGWVQDARFDADSATRLEIVRKSRYFERNNAILNRLADLFEQFTVGPNGIQFIPSSSDEKYNQNAKASYDEWTPYADLTSLHPIATNQSLSARMWMIDGEAFILLTRGNSKTGTTSLQPDTKPRYQIIESHRVATPPKFYDQEGKTIIDGVAVDQRGRPIGYFIKDGVDDDSYTYRTAAEVVHIFEPSRPGQYRGLPLPYAVLNDLHDLDDLQILEMRAALDAAEKSTVYETLSGEVPAANPRIQKFTQTNQTSSGTDVTETKTKNLKNALGGRVFGIKLGEKVSQFQSNRPTVTTQAYWDYLTSKVCAGVGISKLLVLPFTVQGTVARADFDIANAFFRSRSAVLIAAWTRVYQFYMDWAVNNDRRLQDKPGDWKAVDTRAPRSVNVDVGRNSSAMLAELEAGTRTFQSVYAELGLDYRTELRQRAKEAALVEALAKEFKVSPVSITKFALAAIQAEAQPQPATEPATA